MLRQAKPLISAAIILFWVGMMAALLYREVVVPARHPEMGAARVTEPQSVWMGLLFGGARVGFIHWTTTPETRSGDPGYRLRLMARITMPVMGSPIGMDLDGTGWQSGLRGLREFDFSFRAGEHDLRVVGGVEGQELRATVETAGESMPFVLPIGRALSLGGGMGLSSMNMPPLSPGQTVYVESFDPTTMSVGRAKLEALEAVTLEVAGETVETVLIATTIGGITTRAWVNDKQEVVRAETPFGIILEKITPEQALGRLGEDEQADMVKGVAVTPTGPAPRRDARRMLVRIGGVPEDLMPPDGPAQRRNGDVYDLLQLEPVADSAGSGDITGPEAERNLAGDAFITVEHEKIQTLAAEITGQEEDLWTRALRVHDWVFNNIEKKHTLSMPSALEVLRTREGDCNEHSVLYVALARAAGVPARPAIGLAWSEELRAFGYHAWAEVHTGRWTPVDPTFGQPMADATHIKLFDGGIGQWPRLLGYVGKMRIEVLETEQENP